MFSNRLNVLLLILFLTTLIIKQIVCIPVNKTNSILNKNNEPSRLIESSNDNVDPKRIQDDDDDDDDSDDDKESNNNIKKNFPKSDRKQRFQAKQRHTDLESLSD